MKTLKPTLMTLVASLMAATMNAGSREVSYAVEDAAYQAVTRMSADARLTSSVKRLAFVKMWLPPVGKATSNAGVDATVFESALGAVPSPFALVLHSNRDEQWTLIDDVFDQAEDFDSYNPSTHPALQKLQLCDSLLLVKVIGCSDEDDQKITSVRMAMKVIEVKTARLVWSAVIDGQYDKSAAPDNEALPYFVRKALELSAKNAVAKLPTSLDGYGVLMLPLEGRYGHAMTQIFLNALTAAGRQDSIRMYNLPNGNAEDRMMGRFLWERTGSGKAIDPALLKRVEDRVGAKGKLAVMSGNVVTGRVNPETWTDPTGLPVDKLTGTYTKINNDPASLEIIADLKFRDIRDSFRVVAAVSADGVWERDVGDDFWQQLRAFVTVRNAAFALLILIVVGFIFKVMIRVR